MTDSAPRFDPMTGAPIAGETVLRDVAPTTPSTLTLVSMTEEELAAVERVVVFTIDEVDYSIQKRPRVNIALKYLKLRRTSGEDVAVGYLLEESLGSEGYDALADYDGLEAGALESVVKAITKHVLGGLEGPKAR